MTGNMADNYCSKCGASMKDCASKDEKKEDGVKGLSKKAALVIAIMKKKRAKEKE